MDLCIHIATMDVKDPGIKMVTGKETSFLKCLTPSHSSSLLTGCWLGIITPSNGEQFFFLTHAHWLVHMWRCNMALLHTLRRSRAPVRHDGRTKRGIIMKQLQNNFTTIKQSKRLLEIGIPADSADCYTTTDNGRAAVLNILFSEFNKNIVAGGFNNPESYLPCWSVGWLMEICKVCELKKDYEQLCVELNYSKNFCVVICSHIIANSLIIDFSKLEE